MRGGGGGGGGFTPQTVLYSVIIVIAIFIIAMSLKSLQIPERVTTHCNRMTWCTTNRFCNSVQFFLLGNKFSVDG